MATDSLKTVGTTQFAGVRICYILLFKKARRSAQKVGMTKVKFNAKGETGNCCNILTPTLGALNNNKKIIKSTP